MKKYPPNPPVKAEEAPPHKDLGLSNLYAGDPFNSLCGYCLCAFFFFAPPPEWNPEKQSPGQILDKFGVRGIFECCKGPEGSSCQLFLHSAILLPTAWGRLSDRSIVQTFDREVSNSVGADGVGVKMVCFRKLQLSALVQGNEEKGRRKAKKSKGE